MANRTLGNDISHGKIHQNEVLWLFREEKLTILLNFLKKCNFWQQKQFFFDPQTFFSRKSAYITFLEPLQASLVQKISKIL